MKKLLLLLVLSASSLYSCNKTSEIGEILSVNEYAIVWSLIDEGRFDEAKEQISEINYVCEEEFLHQMLIQLYMSIRQKRHEESRMIMKAIDRFSSEVYSTY